MRLVDMGVTVKDRILLHLLDYWGRPRRGEWPPELTQDGIASVVGISRSHVAVTIPDLVDEGLVESSVERVRDRPRRVKVYSLTYRGGMEAGAITKGVLGTTVTAVDDTGEWDIPVDGLIQLHRVHMLVALRTVDEGNRVDLREAQELLEASRGPGPDVGSEAGVGAGEPPGEVHREAPPADVTGEGEGKAEAPSPGEPPSWGMAHPGGDARGERWAGQPQHPPPQQYWSPLRFGTGQRPLPSTISTLLVLGFALSMGTVVLFGIWPVTCMAFWTPMAVVGGMMAFLGLRGLWALGPAREAWTVTALAAYVFVPVSLVCFGVFGPHVLFDLGWALLILGVPSLVLMSGSGHSVARRGSFALLIGPVVVIAALTLAVLDPGGVGSTGALPLLMVVGGAGWSFTGWVMTRSMEDVGGTRSAVAGGCIGLAIASVGGGARMAERGEMTPSLALAVVLWVVLAVYVASVARLPSLRHLMPDVRTGYAVLAVAGAAALFTASAIFLYGGVVVVGATEALIAAALVAMVAPELRRGGRGGWALAGLGVMVAVASVLAFLLG